MEHRTPYVGEGADGARRSAEIDRNEADTLDPGDRRDEVLLSAERWDEQATEIEFDTALDKIRDYVEARPDQDFNASQLARVAKITTPRAIHVLDYMIQNNYIGTAGRGGAWIRYRARRFGEVVTPWSV
jgi:hypothetical protein